MSQVRSPFGFKSLIELVSYFKDEQNCLDYLEEAKWGGNIVCDKCGHDKVYRFSNGKIYKCSSCRHQFTAKTGTIFQDSKISMLKWIMAMHLIGSLKKGLSTRQLAAEINVTQKTAWFMMHRIRESFTDSQEKLTRAVCADECWIGGKNKNRHLDKKAVKDENGNYNDKTPVLGMAELDGKIRCFVVEDRSIETLTTVITEETIYVLDHGSKSEYLAGYLDFC